MIIQLPDYDVGCATCLKTGLEVVNLPDGNDDQPRSHFANFGLKCRACATIRRKDEQ